MFNDMFLKKSDRTFVRCFCHKVPLVFLVIIWRGVCIFVWAYNMSMFFFFLPSLASSSTFPLPSISLRMLLFYIML